MLTSILKQGAEFNSLADTALADRFNSMLDLVARDPQDKQDFPVMMALTNAVPPENLVRSCADHVLVVCWSCASCVLVTC